MELSVLNRGSSRDALNEAKRLKKKKKTKTLHSFKSTEEERRQKGEVRISASETQMETAS